MLIKPNKNFTDCISPNDKPNDLYRKFNKIYTEILHPDNSTYDANIYCLTNNNSESAVEEIMDNGSDGVKTILGYTGMGKTYLM